MTACSEIFGKLEEFKTSVSESLHEISELNATCKVMLEKYLRDTASLDHLAAVRTQAVIDYMYEQVNIGNWKEVKPYLRKTITIASYIKLLAITKSSENATESLVKDLFKIIDFGILFGCPVDGNPDLLQTCATLLSSFNLITHDLSETSSQNQGTVEVDITKYNAQPIEVIDCPSMENFYRNYILAEKPVILRNCINHWPALSKWRDQNYFIKLAGPRTVSIEIGRDYTEKDWTQKLMTIEEFIKDFVYQSNGPTGYLAQYQLFEQIPELKKDIAEPEYCSFADTNEAVDMMAWYGPKGTISPLHYDHKRNLFTQVVGEKQVFLFSPQDTENLYPHEHELLHNTARIDPRFPDYEKYPKYKDAKVYCCVLRAGQMLYIPPKWWHYVESLSISFSVSFWWK
ncbi:bifunctional peptidase and arginyl-hydroxylase JMJD5 [Ostrinia nubilalis]|uniref:bifunctional peptidase and arginyl-hydroxylase JMJD5 n=1 Tax=Ostrinia nubilalis TaxID=29057 RepID=UPI0030824D68